MGNKYLFRVKREQRKLKTLLSPAAWIYNSFTISKPCNKEQPEISEDYPEYVDPGEGESDGFVTKQIVCMDKNMKLSGNTIAEDVGFKCINLTGGIS